jgi:DnaJ-class molecular chaperone
MSWLEYAFGVASRAAKRTWGEMREEYKAGREGQPSPGEGRRRTAVPAPKSSGPPWWEVLHVPRGASLKEAAAAYRELIRQNHPDKVAHLSEKIRRVADEETRRINEAYAEAQRLLGGRK